MESARNAYFNSDYVFCMHVVKLAAIFFFVSICDGRSITKGEGEDREGFVWLSSSHVHLGVTITLGLVCTLDLGRCQN